MKDYAFGNLITALRVSRGFSQFQLGKLLGVSDKAVSKWEHGEATPDIETLCKLADYYGVTLDYLTHEWDEKEKEKVLNENKKQRVNKTIITILSCLIAPLICVTIYTVLSSLPKKLCFRML